MRSPQFILLLILVFQGCSPTDRVEAPSSKPVDEKILTELQEQNRILRQQAEETKRKEEEQVKKDVEATKQRATIAEREEYLKRVRPRIDVAELVW